MGSLGRVMTFRGFGGNKFHARRTMCRAGVMHASSAEAARCDELHLIQVGNGISDLVAHPQRVFQITVNGEWVCDYRADFVYREKNGEQVVEDVKSTATLTAEYKLKKRLLAAALGVHIVEVYRGRNAPKVKAAPRQKRRLR